MAKKMSPERHAVYVDRRRSDREATMQRRQDRAVKMQTRKVA